MKTSSPKNSFLISIKMIKGLIHYGLLIYVLMIAVGVKAQDSVPVFKWNITSKKISDKQYELSFTTNGAAGWQLYAPNQTLSDVPTTEIQLGDSSIQLSNSIKDSGTVKTIQSPIFNSAVKVFEGATAWKQTINISGTVPARLIAVHLRS